MKTGYTDLLNYATKKELELATGIGTYDLFAKKDFTALKAEFDKLYMTIFINVPIIPMLNNLKTKVNNLEKGTHDGTTLIRINQYNTDK